MFLTSKGKVGILSRENSLRKAQKIRKTIRGFCPSHSCLNDLPRFDV